jgi:hypothetical protein
MPGRLHRMVSDKLVHPCTEPLGRFMKELRDLTGFALLVIDTALSRPTPSEATGDDSPATFHQYKRLLMELAVGKAVDNFISYIAELLAAVFRTRPETLPSGDEVELGFVLGHTTMEDFVDSLTDRRVHNLAQKGMRELSAYLRRHLKFDLFPDPARMDKALYYTELRNLLVHNRGRADLKFARKFPNRPALGQPVPIGTENLAACLDFFIEAACDIDRRAVEKFKLPQA